MFLTFFLHHSKVRIIQFVVLLMKVIPDAPGIDFYPLGNDFF